MTSLPPLIGLAHGSRDPRAAAEIGALMNAVAGLRPGLTAVPAFLDLSEPDLVTAVRRIGAPAAVVLPLLFTEAFHTRIDTPAAVEKAAAETGSELTTGSHLGTGDVVLGALQQRTAEAGIRPGAEIVLLAVGSSDADANAEVEALATRWSGRRTATVTARFATSEPRISDLLESTDLPGAIVPLFLASGLLLDATAKRAAALGIPVAAPLGTLLAPLILERYDEAIRQR